MLSAMKNKFFSYFLLSFIFLFIGSSAAQAIDVPDLSWERGRQQSITLGGQTGDKLWSIRLQGQSQSLTFDRSSVNKDGFIVYSLDIPADFVVGRYQVLVSGPGTPDSTTAYVNVLETVSYDPLADPKGVGAIAVVAFTLIAFFAGNKEEQETDSNGGEQESNENENDDDSTSLGSVDSNYQGINISNIGKGDSLGIGKSALTQRLDQIRHLSVFDFSSHSPLAARVVADGTYLQSILGSLSFLFPVLGIALGIWISQDSELSSSLIPTSLALMLAIIALGIIDSLAGLMAVVSFAVAATINGEVTNAADIRTLLGLSLLWFTPSLVAGATRPLRRARDEWSLWERLSDIAISTILTGWAIKGMVLALDGFARQKTEIAEHSDLIAMIGASLIFLRYLLEEFASRFTPRRLEYLSPPKLKSQDLQSFLLMLLVRALVFLFFMYGFFGLSWQIIAATVILILPTLLKRIDGKLPNFSWLWQIIPGGIPSIVFMSLIGFVLSGWVNSLPLISADKTKTILVLTSLPGFAIGLLKLFGRSPKSGDVRWYRRDKLRPLYYTGGPVMLAIATLITMGILP
jgi:hypothetical protein